MTALAFLPLKILLITIDFLITLVTFKWINAIIKLFEPESLRSVPVNDGEESHRVDPRFKGNLAKYPRPGVTTLYEFAKSSFERHENVRCMGTRKFLGWKVPGVVKEFADEIEWITFKEMNKITHQFGAALRGAGCVAAPSSTNLNKVKTPCRLAIFENTSAPWMLACMGAFTQAITVVTVYATLGMGAVVEAIEDNLISVIVCNKKDVSKLVEKCPNMKTLKVIVYTNDICGPDEKIPIPAAPNGVTIISFDDFVASGDTAKYPPTPPEPGTCAVVMYTSGSTAKPKGVIITHAQVLAACAAAEVGFGIRDGNEIYLAYLPLAHIMELMAEFVMIGKGCTLCYADPKSLSTKGAYPLGAMEVYCPTIMVAVPKIWDTIKKGVEAKVALGSPVLQFLVKTAFEWRKFCLMHGFDAPLFKALVFKKLLAAVGGQLRLAVSGGGPINAEVQQFCRVAFGFELVQGYGLTETCAGGTFQALGDWRTGVAGVPIASVEIKLSSTPEFGDNAGQPYLTTDRRDVNGDPVFGRGEILIRGGCVSCGYYMMPELTKESFADDGWFSTGDIGQFASDGSLQIVDRKKNLVKLKGGEYVALERMEMTYGNSTFVDAIAGGICCYGDADMDRPIALLQLNAETTMKWAKENGIEGDFEKVKNSKELYDAVMKAMLAEHAKSDLSHLEKLVGVALLSSPWTPENGCLTAANKLQRRAVIEQFKNEFEETKKKGVFA